jgi:hypothetical protein
MATEAIPVEPVDAKQFNSLKELTRLKEKNQALHPVEAIERSVCLLCSVLSVWNEVAFVGLALTLEILPPFLFFFSWVATVRLKQDQHEKLHAQQRFRSSSSAQTSDGGDNTGWT